MRLNKLNNNPSILFQKSSINFNTNTSNNSLSSISNQKMEDLGQNKNYNNKLKNTCASETLSFIKTDSPL